MDADARGLDPSALEVRAAPCPRPARLLRSLAALLLELARVELVSQRQDTPPTAGLAPPPPGGATR
jgi:hypothetical protein